jgi:hypothetical protein
LTRISESTGKNICSVRAGKDLSSLMVRIKTLLMMNKRCHLSLVVIAILLMSLSGVHLSAAVTDKSGLMKLISENEDPLINIDDLAFLLVTHNFDAVPKKDFVEVHLDKIVYKLVPNGAYPGLANVTIES